MNALTSSEEQALQLIRSKGVDAFRRTYVWKKKSEEIRARDHWECQDCKAAGKYTPATCVHHIRPLHSHPALALTDSNLISLCDECHEARHGGKPLTPERW